MGLRGPQSPGWLAALLVIVALTPLAIGYASRIRPRIGQRLGLLEAIPSQAVLDPSGIELSETGRLKARYQWSDIAALERADGDWRLVGPDGSTVAAIPRQLAWPRPSWFDAPTLAEAIVEMRPDRYALRGGRFGPGLTECALRDTGDPVGRVRTRPHWLILGTGIVLFVVAFVALFAMLSDPP